MSHLLERFPLTLPYPASFGGRSYRLRRLEPGDAPALQAFFESHTSETVRERYGYLVGSMSPERAAALVGVDQSADCALGIFEPTAKGEVLHAVGRYCLGPGPREAEFALVVRENRRRLGMGSLLLRTLVGTARERGLSELWGQIDSDNGAMLALARAYGFSLSPINGGRSERASLLLRAPGPGAAAPAPAKTRGPGARR